MAEILQTAVDTVNSIAGTSLNVFSKFITFNYYIGDLLFVCLQNICSTCISLLFNVFFAVRIMLEDFVVFLAETSEMTVTVFTFIESFLNIVVEFVVNCVCGFGNGIFSFFQSIGSLFSTGIARILYLAANIRFFFDLLGHSIILLCNLFPRTLYVIYVSTGYMAITCKETFLSVWSTARTAITETSPEFLLGSAVAITSSLLMFRLVSRVVRERNLTLESVLVSLLRLLCRVYVCFIRFVARTIGFIFTMVEMTISHLRVPMFAHAGDSDDEGEDRENLVGDVEDESEEEREKADRKRRNYELMVKRAGQRRGSTDSMEDQLLREVEREREDKLCVVCQDKEKCIMILPCRHLCICETCQEPIRTHRNTCPICRRGVKQMIKAYL